MIVIVILLILCVIVEGFIISSIWEDYRTAALELKLLKDAMEWSISRDEHRRTDGIICPKPVKN